MRIKHFAGYGSVKATRVGKEHKFKGAFDGINKKVLIVRVEGNHEWGLVRDDNYDLFNWLVKRFDKSVKDYTQIQSVNINDFYEKQDGIDTEVCEYTFLIKEAA